jgi:hypothetical protein
MTELLLDWTQWLTFRFFLGFVIVVGALCTFAPIFINLDDYKDDRS